MSIEEKLEGILDKVMTDLWAGDISHSQSHKLDELIKETINQILELIKEEIENYQKDYEQKHIAQAVHIARIDELESITGYSKIGGVYTKAGVNTNVEQWQPISITERLNQLSQQTPNK